MESTDKHIIAVVEVWQSQSYWPLNGWGAPNKQLGSMPHFWIPALQVASDNLPENVSAPLDWAWTTQWTVDKSHAFGPHDADGWYYGPNFERLADIIQKKTGADVAGKTSVVRRRRWLRTMKCTAPEILEQVLRRIEKLAVFKKNLEVTIHEKEESLRSIQFYEENRAYAFDQSLNLATQGTLATFAVLKDLFFKLKRLYQFMSERAQVELDYSARIEALGRKYSNSITAEAQNPLLSHPTAHATAAAHAAASAKVEDKSGHSGKSAVAAKTPAKAGPTNTSAAPVTPVVPIATTATSAMSRSFHTITSLTGVLSASKAAVTPLTGTGTGAGAGTVQTGGTPGAAAEDDPSPELDSSSHGRHLIHAEADGDLNEADGPGDFEETYLNRDASAVLFNSLAAMHIAAAERMKQFSGTMKQAAVSELEGVLGQISKLLKEAKATFRKNSDICQLCHAAARSCYETAVAALEDVVGSSTSEMLAFVDEMSALKGTIPTTSAYNTAAMQYTVSGKPFSAASMNLNLAGPLGTMSTHGGGGLGSRRSSFITGATAVATAPKPKPDIWLGIQRYRQVVRDSQEAMCVLITEHMDLELHMQILCNRVYALVLSMANSYHQEQTSLWEESLQLFGNLLGDTIVRIQHMGRPYPILQSPFAKLQAAEVIAASNPSTPVKGQSSSGGNKSPTPRGRRTPAEIQYDDFPSGVGVFSFVVLYREPLPICPSVCQSGDILVAQAKDFLSTKGDVLKTAIWKTVYAVVTSDGYFHLLRRGKCDVPDVSYCIKLCTVQTFTAEDTRTADYGKVVFALKPHTDTDTTVKNGAKKGQHDIYVRLRDEEQYHRWITAINDPLAAPIYVDSEIEDETKQAMLRSMAILRGETEKIDLSLAEYTTDLLTDPTVVGYLAPSMAPLHPQSAASQVGGGAEGGQKYDAFKHRSFIYDEENGDDSTVGMLSPGLLAMGAPPAQPSQIRKRSSTEDSDELDFQPTYRSFSVAMDEDDGEDSGADSEAQGDEDRRDGDAEEDEEEGESQGEGDDEAEAEGEVIPEGDDESSSGASAEEYDPDQDESLVDEGRPDDGGDNDEDRVASEGQEEGQTTAQIGEAEQGGASKASTLYKLPGGSKHRAAREPRQPKPAPHHTTTIDTPQAYKGGSHTRYQKGGDSWIKKDSPGGANLAQITKTPSKGPQPKQIIPASDKKQPLARRHSSMINQYEAGLQEERQKVDNRVKETKRRAIQDVLSRVILDGDETAVAAIDPDELLANPAAVATGKKLVKQMTVKFSGHGQGLGQGQGQASGGASGLSSAAGSVHGEEGASSKKESAAGSVDESS